MKYKVGDIVSLKTKKKQFEGYGFDNSTITKAWETDGIQKYSIKSNKGCEESFFLVNNLIYTL